MANKFSIGDKVIIKANSKRLPNWIKAEIKRFYRIRRIGSIFYDNKTQHTRYYLGTNSRGADISRYPFRAEMLKLYKMKTHTKRLKMQNGKVRIITTHNGVTGF